MPEIKKLQFSSGVAVTTPSDITSALSGELSADKSASYTILDDDGLTTIFVTTAGTNRTMTLPTAADNSDRVIRIEKVDSGTGWVIIDGEGSETINADTTLTLTHQYESVVLQCDGAGWKVMACGGLGTQVNNSPGVISVTTAAYKTLASVELTTGVWDIHANVIAGGSASSTAFFAGIATATDSNTGHVADNSLGGLMSGASFDVGGSMSGYRLTVTSATTYYLTAIKFGATGNCYGRLSAVKAKFR